MWIPIIMVTFSSGFLFGMLLMILLSGEKA
jgi:hypothetical protein